MKYKSYSERKRLRTPQLIKESSDYVNTMKDLETDFDKVKNVIKNSSITAFEVWLELGVKAGVIKEQDAKKIYDKQNESVLEEGAHTPFRTIEDKDNGRKFDFYKTPSGKLEYQIYDWDDVDGDWFKAGAISDDVEWLKNEENPEIDALLQKMGLIKESNEEGGEVSPEAEEALADEIEAALKTVINDLPKELKTIADGGELELADQFDKEAEKELNEAVGALIAGGALALPALTQILGKTVKWAGGKLGSDDVQEWGASIEHIGHDLHHKYEKIVDKILSPFTKNMDPEKRALTNKLIFYSIVAVLGGAGIAGAAKAAGAGQAGLAAVEGGLSGVKATELVAAAKEIIPRVLSNMVKAV